MQISAPTEQRLGPSGRRLIRHAVTRDPYPEIENARTCAKEGMAVALINATNASSWSRLWTSCPSTIQRGTRSVEALECGRQPGTSLSPELDRKRLGSWPW